MKILHTYCLNYNIGDYALGIGLKNLLREHLEVEFIGDTNIQGREFNEYYINEVVNKRYDLLVIGGGGIIHGSHWPNGWFWLIEKDLIKQIKIPFIVYGVGYNYWEEEGGIPERGTAHLNETIKYATYFSVRNDGSAKRILKQTGIDAPSIPDPGFHINLNTDYLREIKEPYVIIQIANDKPESRFGSLENRTTFIDDMREVSEKLSENYKVLLAPHVPDDVSISNEVAKDLPLVDVWDFGYFAFDHCQESLGYYKYADFAIAMRGHGQIVPIAFNTPVIALENHPKHKGLMEGLNLLEYNIKIGEPCFKQNLLDCIENLISNKEDLENSYKKINEKILTDSAQAFSSIKKILNG
jgi:polysaccharide pyruvyl transferase WcaK-like protein